MLILKKYYHNKEINKISIEIEFYKIQDILNINNF